MMTMTPCIPDVSTECPSRGGGGVPLNIQSKIIDESNGHPASFITFATPLSYNECGPNFSYLPGTLAVEMHSLIALTDIQHFRDYLCAPSELWKRDQTSDRWIRCLESDRRMLLQLLFYKEWERPGYWWNSLLSIYFFHLISLHLSSSLFIFQTKPFFQTKSCVDTRESNAFHRNWRMGRRPIQPGLVRHGWKDGKSARSQGHVLVLEQRINELEE